MMEVMDTVMLYTVMLDTMILDLMMPGTGAEDKEEMTTKVEQENLNLGHHMAQAQGEECRTKATDLPPVTSWRS